MGSYTGATGRDEDMAVEQSVLPVQHREAVLKLAHKIPLAGHMGKKRMALWILQRFYRPNLFRDVARILPYVCRVPESSSREDSESPDDPTPSHWRTI